MAPRAVFHSTPRSTVAPAEGRLHTPRRGPSRAAPDAPSREHDHHGPAGPSHAPEQEQPSSSLHAESKEQRLSIVVAPQPMGLALSRHVAPTSLLHEVPAELLVEQVFGLLSDVLAHLVDLLGLRHFTRLAGVNRAWRAAVEAKHKEWGLLVPAGQLGPSLGRLRGRLDMPTHCAILPGGHVCVVDSCNERLVALQRDGQVLKLVGRPGSRRGQLSSPSGAACDPKRGVLFATSLIETPGGGHDGRTHAQRCILKLSLPGYEVLQSSPLRPQESLDAPEGMAVVAGRLYVVDQGKHTIAAFDADTLALIGFCGQHGKRGGMEGPSEWLAARQADGCCGFSLRFSEGRGVSTASSSGLFLNCPTDIAALEPEPHGEPHAATHTLEPELFVTDTHNNRIVCISLEGACLGFIGTRGVEPGQFIYPKGVAVAHGLLYVSEERRVQVLTPLGEPRIIVPVPGSGSLGGICADGRHVFVTDADEHVVHVMQLRHESRARAAAGVQAEREAERADSEHRAEVARQRDGERAALVRERDIAIRRLMEAGGSGIGGGARARRQAEGHAPTATGQARDVPSLLGLEPSASRAELMRQVRLLMRLLHPDRGINLGLRGTPEGDRIEAAFKRLGNLNV